MKKMIRRAYKSIDIDLLIPNHSKFFQYILVHFNLLLSLLLILLDFRSIRFKHHFLYISSLIAASFFSVLLCIAALHSICLALNCNRFHCANGINSVLDNELIFSSRLRNSCCLADFDGICFAFVFVAATFLHLLMLFCCVIRAQKQNEL